MHLLAFRKHPSRLSSHSGGCNFTSIRIPFFFEPNFDAFIKPLDAALRMQAEDTNFLHPGQGSLTKRNHEPVRYGEFLRKKVGNNFDTGKGRYD